MADEPIQTGIAGEDQSEPANFVEEVTEKYKFNFPVHLANQMSQRYAHMAASFDRQIDQIGAETMKAWAKRLHEQDYQEAKAEAYTEGKVLDNALVAKLADLLEKLSKT